MVKLLALGLKSSKQRRESLNPSSLAALLEGVGTFILLMIDLGL